MPSDCSALKEGERGKRRKEDETKMMGAVARKEHLGTLANNRNHENQHRGTRGVGADLTKVRQPAARLPGTN